MLTRFKNKLLARAFTAFPSLAADWGKKSQASGGEVPFVPASKNLRLARVALVSTGGVHLKSQQPFNMADPDGDASWREIPIDAAREDLTITHDYYTHTDAQKDINLVYPVERLTELAAQGIIGSVAPFACSLMGHIDGPHIAALKDKTAPEVARKLKDAQVDYALLVPA